MRYRLELIERPGKGEIKAFKSGKLKMFVRKNATGEQKEKLLSDWYREQLKAEIPKLLTKWQPIIGIDVAALTVTCFAQIDILGPNIPGMSPFTAGAWYALSVVLACIGLSFSTNLETQINKKHMSKLPWIT